MLGSGSIDAEAVLARTAGLKRRAWGHSQNSMGTPSRPRQHVRHRLATADNHSDTCCAAVPCSYTCSARGILGTTRQIGLKLGWKQALEVLVSCAEPGLEPARATCSRTSAMCVLA